MHQLIGARDRQIRAAHHLEGVLVAAQFLQPIRHLVLEGAFFQAARQAALSSEAEDEAQQ